MRNGCQHPGPLVYQRPDGVLHVVERQGYRANLGGPGNRQIGRVDVRRNIAGGLRQPLSWFHHLLDADKHDRKQNESRCPADHGKSLEQPLDEDWRPLYGNNVPGLQAHQKPDCSRLTKPDTMHMKCRIALGLDPEGAAFEYVSVAAIELFQIGRIVLPTLTGFKGKVRQQVDGQQPAI